MTEEEEKRPRQSGMEENHEKWVLRMVNLMGAHLVPFYKVDGDPRSGKLDFIDRINRFSAMLRDTRLENLELHEKHRRKVERMEAELKNREAELKNREVELFNTKAMLVEVLLNLEASVTSKAARDIRSFLEANAPGVLESLDGVEDDAVDK